MPDARLLWPLQSVFETAEEALEATGFLADRPPQEHGETGHSFYTVQPMQVGWGVGGVHAVYWWSWRRIRAAQSCALS